MKSTDESTDLKMLQAQQLSSISMISAVDSLAPMDSLLAQDAINDESVSRVQRGSISLSPDKKMTTETVDSSKDIKEDTIQLAYHDDSLVKSEAQDDCVESEDASNEKLARLILDDVLTSAILSMKIPQTMSVVVKDTSLVLPGDDLKPLPNETVDAFWSRNERKFTPQSLAAILGKPHEFHSSLRTYFLNKFNFQNYSLEYALRVFCRCIAMPKESQQMDRVVVEFCRKYYEDNAATSSTDQDGLYILVICMMSMNTQLHNVRMKEYAMTVDIARKFCESVGVLPVFIEASYYSIKKERIYGCDGVDDAEYAAHLNRTLKSVEKNSLPKITSSSVVSYRYTAPDALADRIKELNLYEIVVPIEFDIATLKLQFGGQRPTDAIKNQLFAKAFKSQNWISLLKAVGYDFKVHKSTGEPTPISPYGETTDAVDDDEFMGDDMSIATTFSMALSRRSSIASNLSRKSTATTDSRKMLRTHQEEAVQPPPLSSTSRSRRASIGWSIRRFSNSDTSKVFLHHNQRSFSETLGVFSLAHWDIRDMFSSSGDSVVDLPSVMSLLYHCIKTYLIERQEKSSILDVSVKASTSASSAIVAPAKHDVFGFIKERMQFYSKDPAPILIHQGPLMRKSRFQNRQFKTALTRQWTAFWCCLVLCPQSENLEKFKALSKSGLMVRQKCMMPAAELWIFGKETANNIDSWLKSNYQAYLDFSMPPPNVPTIDEETVDNSKIPDAGGKPPMFRTPSKAKSVAPSKLPTKTQQTSSKYVKKKFIVQPLPLPSKRIRLTHALAFVDSCYTKHPDSFVVAVSNYDTTRCQFDFTKQASYITSDGMELDNEESGDTASISLHDFSRELTHGVKIQQYWHAQPKDDEELAGSFEASQRHHWLSHINQCSALSTLYLDMWIMLDTERTQGKWSAICRDVRSHCKNPICALKDKLAKTMADRLQYMKKQLKIFDKQPSMNEEELWLSNLDVERDILNDSVPWADIKLLLERVNTSPVLVALVSTVIRVHKARDENSTRQLVLLTLMKLKHLSYSNKVISVTAQIAEDTSKINQLGQVIDMSHFEAEKVGGAKSATQEEGTVVTSAGKSPVTRFETVITDPGSKERRGYVANTIRAKEIPILSETAASSSARSSPVKDVHSDVKATIEVQNSAFIGIPPKSDNVPIQRASSPIRQIAIVEPAWHTRFTNPFVHQVHEQVKEIEKNIELLRLDCQKWKVYCTVVSRCIVGMELELDAPN